MMSNDWRPKRYEWTTSARYRTMGETKIVEDMLQGGWAFELAQGKTERALQEAHATLKRLVSLGLPFRVTPEGRAFDPVELFNFSKSLALDGRDSFWPDRCVETMRGLVGLFKAGADPSVPVVRRFELNLRRTFNVTTLDRTKPHRFRLPMPIEDENLGDVVVDQVEAGPLDWRISGDRCRIEARGVPPPGAKLSLSARFSFTTRPGPIRTKGDDWAKALQHSEGMIEVTSRVQDLADRLAGGSTAPQDVVARFWDFMLDELMCGGVHYDEVAAASTPIGWVLESGRYDCQLGASLLAALCRARNIPARVIGGYLLHSIAASYHYWTEVWFEDEGWCHYDTLAWDLSAGGHDLAWRGQFAGSIEPRMKTQCLPLKFTGFPGVAFSEAWHLLTRKGRHGTETSYSCVDTGALIYADQVDVVDLGPVDSDGQPGTPRSTIDAAPPALSAARHA